MENNCICCGEPIADDIKICAACENLHSAERAAIRDFANRLLKAKFYVDCSFCEGRRHVEEAVSVGTIEQVRDGMIKELTYDK